MSAKTNKPIRYFAAIGTPENHLGVERQVKTELQIGDYVEIYEDLKQDDDYEYEFDGTLFVVKSRYYCTKNHDMIFFCEKLK